MPEQKHSNGNLGLYLIAAFKLLDALLLAIIGFGFLRLLNPQHHEDFKNLIAQFQQDPHSEWLNNALSKMLSIQPKSLKAFGIGSLAYGSLFLVEGIGLIYKKIWAEWMVVVTTSVFLPIEIYELFKKPTPLRVGMLLLNIVVVAYLVIRLKKKTAEESEPTESSEQP